MFYIFSNNIHIAICLKPKKKNNSFLFHIYTVFSLFDSTLTS